jgi:hypothetical protein
MVIGCGEDLPKPKADTVFGDAREVVARLLLHSMLDQDQPSRSVTTASSSAAQAPRVGRSTLGRLFQG